MGPFSSTAENAICSTGVVEGTLRQQLHLFQGIERHVGDLFLRATCPISILL